MLEDNTHKRILLTDGTSLVGVDTYVKELLKTGTDPEWAKVVECEDSHLYDFFYDKQISFDEDSYEDRLSQASHITTDEDIEAVMSIIENSDRYDGSDRQLKRLSKEIDFFTRTGNIPFLLNVYDLVQYFIENSIVWGVGRGSACASLILFIIGVHDVDPLKYGIKFSELSKDIEDD